MALKEFTGAWNRLNHQWSGAFSTLIRSSNIGDLLRSKFYTRTQREVTNWYRYGADAVKDIPKICTYGEFSKHIKMVPSSDVLESPLTEIILAYFPQDISEEKKEALSSKIQKILRQAFPDEARVAHAWGVENDFPARGEDGQPRSVLMGFVGLSHSEAWETYHQADAWKEALSSIERLEGCTSIYSFAIRSQHLERLEGF